MYKELKAPTASKTLGGVIVVPVIYIYKSIILHQNNLILTESSSDTIFRFFPDYSMSPFIVRTPSIQSMKPEIFLFPLILTDRYYFLESVKNIFSENNFPKTQLMYDRQEKKIYEYTVNNDDFSIKHADEMKSFGNSYSQEIAFSRKFEAFELVEAFKKGELKGKLKEVASKLNDESNPVIMLVKYKK